MLVCPLSVSIDLKCNGLLFTAPCVHCDYDSIERANGRQSSSLVRIEAQEQRESCFWLYEPSCFPKFWTGVKLPGFLYVKKKYICDNPIS